MPTQANLMSLYAWQSFNKAQGLLGHGAKFPPTLERKQHDLSYIAFQLFVLREALTEMSVGFSQLSAAIRDLDSRVPEKPVQPVGGWPAR